MKIHINHQPTYEYPWGAEFSSAITRKIVAMQKLGEIEDWCVETFTEEQCDWSCVDWCSVWFKSENDLALFVLRWS
jgi:hypothetical protein